MTSAGKDITNLFLKKTPKQLNNIMNKDSELIFENYKYINVKQLMLESSFDTFERNAPNVNTLEEAYAILDIYEMLEEAGFFGAVKNVARGAGTSLKSARSKIAAGTRKVGNMVKSGAQQAGSNVADMARTGAAVSQGQQVIKQAATAAQQIIDLVNKAKQISPETFTGSQGRELAQNISNLPLEKIMGYLDQLAANTAAAAQAASDKGIFGGDGEAAPAAQPAAPAAQPAAPAAQPAQPGAANVSPIFQR